MTKQSTDLKVLTLAGHIINGQPVKCLIALRYFPDPMHLLHDSIRSHISPDGISI